MKGKGAEKGLGKGLGEGEGLGSVVKTAGWTWPVIQAGFSFHLIGKDFTGIFKFE